MGMGGLLALLLALAVGISAEQWEESPTCASEGGEGCSTPASSVLQSRSTKQRLHQGPTWTLAPGGQCTQSGDCISSPNYPNIYGNGQQCTISVPESMGPIRVERFVTEQNYDKLNVNGEQYHGTDGPEGVVPTSDIRWSADGSEVMHGWKICASICTQEGGCVPTQPPTPVPPPAPPCGVKGPDNSPWGTMIVNGQVATECEWKWQVQLRSGTSGGGHPFCGGALIGDRWVMTAAHCTARQAAGSFTVKLGDYDRTGSEGNEQDRNVRAIHNHPSYRGASSGMDFAILELETPVTWTDCIAPVCLPEVGEVLAPSVDCFITGWGTLSSGGSQPRLLMEAVVKTKSNAGCNSAYGGGITEDMLCASGHNSAGAVTDACQGDSGGPLVCDAGSGRFVLHGATSWGRGCADASYPGVWARVEHQLQWIHSVVGTPGTSPPTQPPVSPTQPTNPPTQPPTQPPAAVTGPPGPPGPAGQAGPQGPPGPAGPPVF